MIVTTAPTGDIGGQLLRILLDRTDEPVRVIVRDPSRLSAEMRERVDVVPGSHADADVVAQAFDGADALFWLVPPDPQAATVEAAYSGFSAAAVQALADHGVQHVVAVSALGRGTPVADRAGLVTATLAVDDLIASTGVAYRALACAGFMDNVLRQVASIREDGVFSWPLAPDVAIPLVATADIAGSAAELLLDRTWTGVDEVPLLGPEDITPAQLVDTIADVVGRPVRFEEQSLEAVEQGMRRYASDGFATAMRDMMWATQNGLDDGRERTELSGTTTFRQWCERKLRR